MVPLAIVASAFACANLATVKLSHRAAAPGTQVSFIGRNFNSNPAASPVALRWNGRSGAVLYEGRPVDGKLRGTFTVPRARSGNYIIVATQTGPNGRIASGTPGRAPLKVRASSSGAVLAPPSTGNGPVAPQGLIVAFGLSALMLSALATVSIRRRRSGSALTSTI